MSWSFESLRPPDGFFPAQDNILIDEAGNARLADFGQVTILSDPGNGFFSSSNSPGGTIRWMSPEMITPEDFGSEKSRATKSSDCYALGMVVYEVIGGKVPFHEDTDIGAYLKVVRGERPRRGVEFTDNLWKVLEWCWVPRPGDHPSVEDVLWYLETDSNLREGTCAGMKASAMFSLQVSISLFLLVLISLYDRKSSYNVW